MQISFLTVCCLVVCQGVAAVTVEAAHHHKGHHHHHKNHHKHHHKHHHHHVKPAQHAPPNGLTHPKPAEPTHNANTGSKSGVNDATLVAKMKNLEQRIKNKTRVIKDGHIFVTGPLPVDFNERFRQAAAQATGADPQKVTVEKTLPVADQPGVFAVDFTAPANIVFAVEEQATDPDSKLAEGNMHSFLVAKDGGDDDDQETASAAQEPEQTAVLTKGIDVDTQMPYGELEPFGREDTAQELTEDSVTESNEMVDQLERAEVAEEKRAVFRALTRLRGAAITSFDGVARAQTGQIDEYNKIHKWRTSHPLHHLADEESDVSKWAFPDNADF